MDQNMKTSVDETFDECDEGDNPCIQWLVIWTLFIMG